VCGAQLRKLADDGLAAQRARDAAIAKAHAEVAEERAAAEAEIGPKAQEELQPLFQKFALGRDTRVTAAEISLAVQRLNNECVERLGAPLDWRHLAIVVAFAHDLAEQVAGGQAGYEFLKFGGYGAGVAGNAQKAFELCVSNAAAPALEEVLLACERALCAAFSAPGVAAAHPPDPWRLARMCSVATKPAVDVAINEANRPPVAQTISSKVYFADRHTGRLREQLPEALLK
jgi:hypothetical protein